jgi:hypothetical protein
MSDSHNDDEGVIGYQPTKVTPAIMQPIAAAAFPSIRIIPDVLFIGSTTNGSCLARLASAKSYPALRAPMFSSIALSFFPSCFLSAFSICAMSIDSRRDSTPS